MREILITYPEKDKLDEPVGEVTPDARLRKIYGASNARFIKKSAMDLLNGEEHYSRFCVSAAREDFAIDLELRLFEASQVDGNVQLIYWGKGVEKRVPIYNQYAATTWGWAVVVVVGEKK